MCLIVCLLAHWCVWLWLASCLAVLVMRLFVCWCGCLFVCLCLGLFGWLVGWLVVYLLVVVCFFGYELCVCDCNIVCILNNS